MIARHGDVVIRTVKKVSKDAKPEPKRKELAYGEVTGHAHRIDTGKISLLTPDSGYLTSNRDIKLSHEEHKTKTLPKGKNYFFYVKRQYGQNGQGWEKVRD